MRSTTTVTAEEQPSTSNTIAQTQSTSVSTSSGGFRRSLYQSLPLYWQKGWRTHGAELDGPAIQQKRFSKRHTTTGHVTSTAASLPPKPSRPDNRRKRSSPADSAYRFLLDGQQKPAEDKQQRRNISWQRTTFKYKPNQRLQNATSTHIPEEHVRHGRLILLTLISGSCLLLLLSLLHILGPSFFVPTEQPTHTTVNSLKKELKKLKSAYSEIRPSEAQIWLLNTHEFYRRQKRQVSDAQPANDPYLFGIARLCGSNCTFRLKHGMAQTNFGESIHGEKLNIKLSRMESVKNQKFIEKQKSFFLFPLNNSSSKRQSNLPHSAFQRVQSSILPLIQLMDSDNMTELRRPHISPNCFYIAEVELASEQSLLNLCDRNGGMFGSLALVEGAFLIEPLLLEDEEEHYEQQSADKPQKQRRRRRMTSPAELRPHLIYPVRTQHFGDDQQQRKRNGTNSRSSSSSGSGTKNSEEFEIRELHRQFWMQRNASAVQGWQHIGEGNQNDAHNQQNNTKRGRRSPPVNSWDHYVEVLAVADYRMLLYHQQNLENYVLTLFSTVASIYRHPSLGVAVNVVVVRLVILKSEKAGPMISNRAQETLQHFCQWQQLYNDHRNEESLNHHDVAILLTRHDICRYICRATNKCDTLGLAELGTMCDAKRSCAIIEDNGLSAAFTIAHELGHIFNIPHDDERKCAEFMPLNKANYHIMAPTLEYNTNPWSWSACSSAMLIRFLDTQKGQTQCILDQPAEKRYYEKMFETPAPGAIYSVSQQCKFVFGSSAEICPYMPSCRRLWCSVSYGNQLGCRTQHMPWADGTECGHQMWCYRGQCVGMSPSQRQPVDGGWGDWNPWHDCSRTCGGGIQKAYRDCDSPRPENGGKYCTGQRVRYRPCNIEDCPWDMPGFREQQCSEFDGKDVGIHEVPRETRWLPKYTGVAENERCRLYCRAADSAAFYLLGEKVIDGTPCDRNGHDICIDGACHKAGCDHRLGSDMKRDICGVCGGDGGTCREVKGLYNDKGTFGYNEVLRIPAGAANIDITQSAHNNLGEDDNYLALRMANGEWLLNGQYQVSVFRQQIPVLDAVLEYSGSDTAQERINGTGPLRSDIYLHVLCVGSLNNPNVNYRFMEPIPQQLQQQQMRAVEQQVKVANSFYWRQLDQWTECSHKCQGSQNQQLACADTLSNRPAPEAYCAAIRRPAAQQRMCNEECNYKYQHMLKADSSGRHWYQHKCVRSFTTGREEYATESECQLAGIPMPTLEPKPAESSASREVQPQQKPQSIPMLQPQIVTDRRWAYTEWNQCSESCGTSGIRRRALHCIDTRNGQKLDNRFCEGILHESTETECNRMPCPHWVFGPWSECSRSCGGGIRLRHAACQDSVGRDVHMTLCSVAYKKDSEKCNEQQCSEWRFGPWSQCSVSCGQGVERREARCVDTEGRPLNEAACNARKRIVEQKCELAACPQWKTGSWSQCSVTCGVDGFHTRVVQCVDSVGRKLADQRCLKNEDDVRPQTHKVCSPGPCPHWRTTDWSKCSVSCGQGVRERQVECVTLDGTVDDSLCPDKQRPLRQDRCVLMACAFWSPEAWSSCSTTCGLGVQRRAVNCIRSSFSRLQGNRSIVVHDRECSGQKPRIERSCERLPCSPTLAGGAHWDTGFWTDCSAQTCVENGTQRRTVECRNAQRLLPSSFCSHLERPPTAQTCICPNSTGKKEPMTIISITTTQLPEMKKLKSAGHWEAGNWSSCSISCGGGWRRRSLFCNTANGTFGPCPEADRPVQFEQCNQQHCSIGQWHIGAWSPCSVTCGGGEQNRKVWCNSAVNLLQRLEASQCPVEEKPLGSRVCTRPKCPSNMLIITTTTEATKTLTKTINDELPSESPTRAVVTFTPSLKPSESGSSENSLPNSVPSTEASSSNLQFRWESGPWSPCPRHCGPTVRTRKVHCVDPASGQSIVDQTKCPKAQKPPAEHRCRQMSCPRWHKGDWTLCSTSCGIGVSQREVYCRKGRIAAQRVSDAECLVAESKPFETRRCELARCPNYNWRVGPWSKCADPCKPGEQRRRIFCMSDLGKRAAHKMCEPNGKKSTAAQPAETRKCPTDKCPYHWVAGPWSTCSRTCGTGFHFRRIECKVRKKPTAETNNSSNANIGTEPTVLSRMCIALEKPQVTRQCVLSATCDAEFHWSVGPWSQCSRNCGPGFRHRKVRCLDSRGDRAARDSCETKNRPRKREACFLRNCMPADCSELKAQQIGIGSEQTMNDGNYTVLVAGFQIGVYCYRMNETLPKTYLNVRSDGNFAEFYGKRLVYPYSCPHEGRRNESCACTSDGHIGQGLSRFRKIRVDLQNMKINSNDHTFAVTEYGSPVAYGTAGDCYSMSDCPQGRFSIDLRDTGLRLVDDLHWTDQGHRTSSRIERSDNNALIQGFCGGYCGECAPDRFKGLALEVDQRQSPIIGAA